MKEEAGDIAIATMIIIDSEMSSIKILEEEDLIKLSQICGVSHDIAEILREQRKDIWQNERLSKHIDFITSTLEKLINKYSDETQELKINNPDEKC